MYFNPWIGHTNTLSEVEWIFFLQYHFFSSMFSVGLDLVGWGRINMYITITYLKIIDTFLYKKTNILISIH